MSFDFQSYVQRRQANPDKSPVRIQNYAYIEDIEHLRTIASLDILRQAVSLGLQAWQFAEGRKLQKKSQDIGKSCERVSLAWNEVCFSFTHSPHPLKIIPIQKTPFEAYGDSDGVFFGISPDACGLPTSTLKFLFGRGIGALDNSHVPYITLQRFFDSATRGLWERATQFPDALLHWRCAAEITEDRAGMLACRDISGAIFGIMRMELDWDNDEIMREIRRYHEGLDVDWGESVVEKRIKAIEIFTKSNLYQHAGGLTMQDVDEQVKRIL